MALAPRPGWQKEQEWKIIPVAMNSDAMFLFLQASLTLSLNVLTGAGWRPDCCSAPKENSPMNRVLTRCV